MRNKQDHLDFRKLKTEFKNAKELKEYSFDNFNIDGVLSSLIDQTDDPEPDTTLHARKISSFMSTAYYVFRSVRSLITKHSIQKIYLFNGRHAYENAVISAAREEGIGFPQPTSLGMTGTTMNLILIPFPMIVNPNGRQYWTSGITQKKAFGKSEGWLHVL